MARPRQRSEERTPDNAEKKMICEACVSSQLLVFRLLASVCRCLKYDKSRYLMTATAQLQPIWVRNQAQ